MALQQEWEKIARELGDYDLETKGSAYMHYEALERVTDEYYVGQWVESEKAAKEIERLRERVAKLERVRESAQKVESLIDAPEHMSHEFGSCRSLVFLGSACDCGAQDQFESLVELAAALAAAKGENNEG